MPPEDLLIEITFGDRRTTGKVVRAERRYLRIEVDPNGSINVTAPMSADLSEIVRRVNRRGGWIFQQLDSIADHPVRTPERRYVSGETHLFLGRQYRLAIEAIDDPCVRIDGARLLVGVRKLNDQAHYRRLLTAFYALQSRDVFRERLEHVFPPFARKGLTKPPLIIRKLSKRWGSYTPKGRIVLNVDLVRASPLLIDYVICHELVHAFHPDHGKEWRSMFDAVMPDWQQRKSSLEAALR
ncbi:conserved hypothetical protein [Bosea sp. 62]|uniref:M48 family metallopeptidase n=1 Tax=unclassified Bosea (in: a-proteobacteria) TaxID=2653178 RepID=UPI00125A3C6C|nr:MULTISPECIES: SprT family zinc-dependent metalloprotease [unclassified Bosea (in: a-proteobacteria)]CAD5257337.1 conserved hypothetical protein [Bosea sp. 7B]CAD5272937.1 conserved hypothetical protein [Bosea sp. 21B]CAD5285196.1 conserved hypothetical protein [Bosea sp. 46]VVT60262.1 conserved hypothetical protein [Bosea sp. EC-HK365B]VXB61459.1 conserved hypothetical protein [Bosea sp. 62]